MNLAPFGVGEIGKGAVLGGAFAHQTADHLVRIVRAIELLGARPIIAGISPAIAQTMVSLGVDLSRLTTLRNLQEALKACMRWLEEADSVRCRSGFAHQKHSSSVSRTK